jgi:hypothetical protein
VLHLFLKEMGFHAVADSMEITLVLRDITYLELIPITVAIYL